jgi:hypothetical protein
VPIAGVWNNPLGGDGNEADSAEAEDHIQGGTFLLKMERRRSGPSAVKGATALAIGRTGAD